MPPPSTADSRARRGPRTRCRAAAAAGLFTLSLLLLAHCDGGRGPGDGPNVLMIVLDTVRADRLSALGYERPTTPNLERLAEESIVFEDAWGPSSWTLPAHATLFTGLHPADVGLADGKGLAMTPGDPTLAQLLRDAGWATGCFTGNGWIGAHSGTTRGFERVEALWDRPERANAADTHRRTLAWMRTQRERGQPFFAFLNDMEAHAPWSPPAEFRDRFVRPGHPSVIVERLATHSVLDPPDGGILIEPDYPGVREAATDLYDGELAALDMEVGVLLDAMRADGLLDETLVVVLSDHGEGLGEHGWMEHGLTLHREILRVPLLVRLPGGTEARRVRDVVRLEDVLPTVLEVCGVDAPEWLRGASLLGPTAGRIAAARACVPEHVMPRTELVLGPERAAIARSLRRSVYDGRWHLLVNDLGDVELYDVAADPAEVVNLAEERPAEVSRLRVHLP